MASVIEIPKSGYWYYSAILFTLVAFLILKRSFWNKGALQNIIPLILLLSFTKYFVRTLIQFTAISLVQSSFDQLFETVRRCAMAISELNAGANPNHTGMIFMQAP